MKKWILIFLLITSQAWGATYYASTEGNDSWNGTAPDYVSGSTGPKLTPAAASALLTSSGDKLYIRGGTYNITTSATVNRSCAVYPRANNCTIAAYPGESVTLKGGRNGSNFGVFPTGGTIGIVSGYSGGTIKGFTIQGMVMFDSNSTGSQPSTVENCDISVGGDGWSGTNQGGVVWMDDSANVVVKNCKLHDNHAALEGVTYGNAGLIMCYEANGLLIENCDFYNSAGTGITMKDDVQNVTIRYNHIYDNNGAGILTGNNTAGSYTKSADIYQNIIRNCNTENDEEHGGITFCEETSLCNIYNNTLYQNYRGDVNQWPNVGSGAVPFAFWNNISSNPRATHLTWPYSVSTFAAQYIDYNDYYNDVTWVYHGNSYTTLSAWVAAMNSVLAGTDSHSVTTDPGFINASGNMNLPSDFKRSSYPANGRGGAYPSVMGAYITGSETIGYSEGGTPTSTPTIRSGGIRNGGLRP